MSEQNDDGPFAARRNWLRHVTVAAGGLAMGLPTTAALAQPAGTIASAPTAVDFVVPAGACDTHVHVFPDPQRFPFWQGRTYTPPVASVGQLLDLQASLGLERVVIVQPSVYGTDNSPTLHGIRMLGQQRARGIAVIGPDATPEKLRGLYRDGIRGIRVNLEAGGVKDPAVAAEKLAAAVKSIQGTDMHLQIYAGLELIAALKEDLGRLPMPAVFDHFAGARGPAGVGQPGFDAVLELVRRGSVYVKVSAPYRSSTQGPDYEDMQPFARALVQANADRILWGTDWPHPGLPAP